MLKHNGDTASTRPHNIHISIDNAKSGQELHQSFFLLKGSIKNSDCSSSATTVHIAIKNVEIVRYEIEPNKSYFKLLIELNEGQNDIEIVFCCSSLNLTLIHSSNPSSVVVLPLYIICDGHDGNFQAPETERNHPESACKRIEIGCKMLQCLFSEKLYEMGFGRKTFKLERCRIFRSVLNFENARKMAQEELWHYFAREIMNSEVGSKDCKYLGFLSCTNYRRDLYGEFIKSHEDVLKITEAHVALGGGGLALFGSGCLYTWPENYSEVESRFKNDQCVNRELFMDDSCYRGTIGGCFSTTLGSVLHELCHTFDLGHTREGVMGRGFDNIHEVFLQNNNFQHFQTERDDGVFWTKSCGGLLNYHRWFNNYQTQNQYKIKFDGNFKIIKATGGLRVIEIRSQTDERVLLNWIFTNKVLKYSFKIEETVLKCHDDPILKLIVMDAFGNILKCNFENKKSS